MPTPVHQSRASTSAESAGLGDYASGQGTSAASMHVSPHVPWDSSLAYQSSTSAASMAIPSLMEDESRKKNSTTPKPVCQRSGSQAEFSSRNAALVINPISMEHDHNTMRNADHSIDGQAMNRKTQQDHQSRHPPMQPSAQPVYTQMTPIIAAPPSVLVQIEHLVFHVSPLSLSEEWDFAFYLACCWNGDPSMLKSTCALYQQWVST